MSNKTKELQKFLQIKLRNTLKFPFFKSNFYRHLLKIFLKYRLTDENVTKEMAIQETISHIKEGDTINSWWIYDK